MITQDPLNPHRQHLATPYGTASVERWLGEGWQDAPDRETIIDGKTYTGPDPMKQYLAEHYGKH